MGWFPCCCWFNCRACGLKKNCKKFQVSLHVITVTYAEYGPEFRNMNGTYRLRSVFVHGGPVIVPSSSIRMANEKQKGDLIMKKSRRIAAAAAVSLTLLTSASAPASAGPTTRLDAWLARSAACALWNINNPIWLTGGPVWYLCREELLAQWGWAPLRGVAATVDAEGSPGIGRKPSSPQRPSASRRSK